MDEDVLSYENIRVEKELANEIWSFDPRNLEHIDGVKLSMYAVALAQYLIYFTSQQNKTKAEEFKLTKFIDRTTTLILADRPELVKSCKTKVAAEEYLISTNEDLMLAQSKLDNVKLELMRINGIDKSISELIGTIKRELTRRENELYAIRRERKN